MASRYGEHIEPHGNGWRVVLRVPEKARAVIGQERIRVNLKTTSLRKANILKHAVIAKLRVQFAAAIREARRRAVTDPLELKALELRERGDAEAREIASMRRARGRRAEPEPARPWSEFMTQDEWLEAEREADQVYSATNEIADVARSIESKRGEDAAFAFYEIASGQATPIAAHLEAYLTSTGMRAKDSGHVRRVVKRLELWCDETQTRKTLEAVTAMVAGRFEDEGLPKATTAVGTFRAYRSALSGYWEWLQGRGQVSANPWKGRKTRRAKPHRDEDEDAGKRPFTDDEVAALLAGDAPQRLRDVMRIAALSGMRLGEIIALRTKHCADGFFYVAKGKTRAGKRKVPIHSELAETLVRLLDGKADEDYLFGDLDEPPDGSERSRASPVSKQFTRYRRKLGIDATGDKQKQSAIDFHSFRRWFIQKRRDLVERRGAETLGFAEWTIAAVVGHAVGSLSMTLEVYSQSQTDAKRSCVEAVGLV